MEILVWIGAFVLLFLLRHFASRRLAKGQGRYAWLIFLPALAPPILILWDAARMAPREPVLALASGAVGALVLGLTVRLISRFSRAVSVAEPGQDIWAATDKLFTDYPVGMTIVILFASLIGGVALVVWAILRH